MYNIIESYIKRLTIEDVNNFALNKNCHLSEEELDYTYRFIKKNWHEILKNPNIFDIDRYQNHYSPENFKKIKQVYSDYYQKFSNYL